MSLPAAVGLITLGVRDVAAATTFYEHLGFELSSASQPGVVSFFHTSGALLGLFGTEDLRQDAAAAAAAPQGFRGVTLAVNVAAPEAVDAALADAQAAGARVVKPAQATEWGGYHGYFADPDGHLWEIAHNPSWPLGDDGLPQLP